MSGLFVGPQRALGVRANPREPKLYRVAAAGELGPASPTADESSAWWRRVGEQDIVWTLIVAPNGGEPGQTAADSEARQRARFWELVLRNEAARHLDSLVKGATLTNYASLFAFDIDEAVAIVAEGAAGPGDILFSETAREYFLDNSTAVLFYGWQHRPTRHHLGLRGYRRDRGWYQCLYDSDLGHLNRPFRKMFECELQGWINPRRVQADSVFRKPISDCRPDVENELFGIALSGGGMRSATFSLGVVQSLVPSGLLNQADYLSSVSGGGYFGVSLAGLCAEGGLPYENLDRLGCEVRNFPFGYHNVIPPEPGAAAVPAGPLTALPIHGAETPALWHVRKFSKLLGNTIGFFDLASWLTVGRFLVSTALLWILFALPMLALIAIVFAFSGRAIDETGWFDIPPDGWGELAGLMVWAFVPAGALLVLIGIPALLSPARFKLSSGFLARLAYVAMVLSVAVIVGALVGAGVWAITPKPGTTDDDSTPSKVTEGNAYLLAGAPAGLALAWGLKQVRDDAATKRRLLQLVTRILTVTGGYILLLVVTVFLTKHFVEHERTWWYVPVAFLLVVALIPAWSWGPRVMNNLSPHQMYADRLQKTWIVSARGTGSTPSGQSVRHWKNVWPSEKLRVRSLCDGTTPTSPYPLICATLSAPGSRGDKYPDRATEPFVIAPLYSGSALTRWLPTAACSELNDLRLAEAAATSGAAVASNATVKDDRSLSIILTLANARLGRWVKNPRTVERRRWFLRNLNKAPLVYFAKELFGLATRDDRHVYLSDGGHFENLGLYELVRRRCKYIIAVAADEEPKGKDDRLGNIATAARLCRVDFRAEIEIGDFAPLIRNKESGEVMSFFAAGRIRYPCAPTASKAEREANSGYIVVVKSGIVAKGITPDLLEHWRSNPDFPYRNISDEQYDFKQFESYRQLGYLAGSRVVDRSRVTQSLDLRFRTLLAAYRQGTY